MPENSLGKLVQCHFGNIREQTPNEEGKPFKHYSNEYSQDFPIHKKDQRCYFKDNALKIYSRGGSEFIVPMHLQVLNVYPIDDGIIVKVLHDKDVLNFDPIQKLRKPQQTFPVQREIPFSYFTLTNHPLDDIYPLTLQNLALSTQMLETHIDIVYCSYKIPLIVLYKKESKQLCFGLLKSKPAHQYHHPLGSGPTQHTQEEDDQYIRSIEPESRNADLYNISKESKLYIEEIFSKTVEQCPDKIILQKGLQSSYELIFCLFFNQTKKLAFISTDLRNLKQFEVVKTLENVQDIEKLNFSRSNQNYQDPIKIISKTLKETLQPTTDMFNAQDANSAELRFLKKRIRTLNKDLLVLDLQGRQLTFYQGCSQIYQVDLIQQIDKILMQTSSLLNKEAQIPKNSKVLSLNNSHKSLLTLNFDNGQTKRMSFQFKITDFLVQSIMKTLRAFLPESTFETLTQDLVETLTFQVSSNFDNSKTSYQDIYQDQFTKFSNMLISILTSDVQAKQSQQYQNQSQQLQSQIAQNTTGGKPASTLQTKILRSSTASFATDSLSRRKNVGGTNTGISTQAVNQPILSQGVSSIHSSVIQNRPSQLRQQLATTIQQQTQQRRVTSGSSELQPSLSTALQGNTPQLVQISQNPFADLLNSDFHKENFPTKFSSFFPSDMKLTVPLQSNQVQEQPITQLLSSPQKKIQQSSLNQTQKIQTISKHQIQTASQTTQSQQPAISHERKNSMTSNLQTHTHLHYKTQKQEVLFQIKNIFQVLHLLYEDLKLNKLRDPIESPKLARLLIRLIFCTEPLKKSAYLDYYFKEHPQLHQEFEKEIKKYFKGDSILKEGVMLEAVPKIYKWFEACLRNSKSPLNYSYPLFFDQSRKICRIYEILSQNQVFSSFSSLLTDQTQISIEIKILENLFIKNNTTRNSNFLEQLTQTNLKEYYMQGQLQDLHLFEKILFCLKDENLSLDEVKKLPSIISLPILEIIRYCRLFQQEIQSVPKWPDSLYKLIHREDILNNLRQFERQNQGFSYSNSSFNANPQASNENISIQLYKQNSKRFALQRGMTNVFSNETVEEIQQEKQRKEMESNILQTAADLIQSKGVSPPEFDKENTNFQKQQLEENIADFLKNRFNQDTRYKEVCNMLSSNAEMIIKLEHIKEFENLPEDKQLGERQALLDRLFLRQLSKSAGRGALGFGTLSTVPTETLHVPKINQTGFIPQTETYMQVEFKDEPSKDITQWPEFHNGVASALRIAQSLKNRKDHHSSHTRNWIMYHKPQEPKYEHGGFLLAIGLLGQLDTLQPTDIYQHLKSTHDATAIGILLGRAASKIGTMDDQDTRTLCIHIPYLLPPTLSIDISLQIQSAAVIGAGLLYKGTSNRLMTEMLLAQIGRKPLSDKAIEREGYALASGIALGLVNLGLGKSGHGMKGVSDLKLNERLIRFVEGGKSLDLPQSMLSNNSNHDNMRSNNSGAQSSQQQCSAIKEGDQVNVHITSPGALIALALIHLKSNNEGISNRLQMPQTFYSLEFIRPSFLLLKVLCKNLIMWDTIQPNKEWIFNQIPGLIREIYESEINTIQKKFSQQISSDDIDYSTIALCYVNIIAGAVFSLGFKYAGTGNKEVFNIILEFVNFFRNLKIVQPNKETIGVTHNNLTKNQIDKTTVETCLCVASYSMSIVMAGTGDVECFRVLRVLRKRFEHDMHYGFNMAIHMSLGFLFLGSGAFTFSRNNLAIASLLCSLYPTFPSHPNDNRYHLQALRHFYVLAIETRLLQARDIDTGEFVNITVNVEVIEEDGINNTQVKQLEMQTPAIINGKIRKIEIKNDQYHYISLKLNNYRHTQGSQNTADMMDIDNSTTNAQAQYNSQFLNNQDQATVDLQQIIYVKKRAFSDKQQDQLNIATIQSQVSSSQTQGNPVAHKYLSASSQHVVDRIKNSKSSGEDQYVKDLANDSQKLIDQIRQIDDQSIKAFYKNFTNLDYHYQSGGIWGEEFPEVEDVILSQSHDHYSPSLSVSEFFRLQDLYGNLKHVFSDQIVPKTMQSKLRALQTVYDCYRQDKLDSTSILLELQNLRGMVSMKKINESKLLQTYLEFTKNSIYLDFQKKQPCVVRNENTEKYEKPESLTASNFDLKIEFISSIGEKMIAEKQWKSRIQLEIQNMLDPHEIQLSRIIIEQILKELQQQGEQKLVETYVNSKITGIIMPEESPLSEINQSLVLSLQQLFDEDVLKPGFIDQVLIPGCLSIKNY